MKYLLLTLGFALSVQAQDQGQGSGSAIGSAQKGQTHVSPGGVGAHPSVQNEATTTTGTGLTGPGTIGHPTYNSSGMTRNRSDDVAGEDASSTTLMSSDKDPNVPDTGPSASEVNKGSMAIRDHYDVGPYRDGQYSSRTTGAEGRQAQEEAQNRKFNMDEEEIEKKQEGN